MENDGEIYEHFFGVYLLYCINPKYKGRVYIGYTVDPNRRVKQHNKGKQYGGAWKTSNRGPWLMVLIIHGFPNNISALRFEWAWQHPHTSRRLQHVPKKKAKEKVYDFTIRVLSEMLQVGPWNRLPLTIRWLNEDYVTDFSKPPPPHMPISHGSVISRKLPSVTPLSETPHISQTSICYFCTGDASKRAMKCLNPQCFLIAHITCFSEGFLKEVKGEYLPLEGQCPQCCKTYLWGDLVRKFKGCYEAEDVRIRVEAGNEFYESESE